jgi:hypothetical protein
MRTALVSFFALFLGWTHASADADNAKIFEEQAAMWCRWAGPASADRAVVGTPSQSDCSAQAEQTRGEGDRRVQGRKLRPDRQTSGPTVRASLQPLGIEAERPR